MISSPLKVSGRLRAKYTLTALCTSMLLAGSVQVHAQEQSLEGLFQSVLVCALLDPVFADMPVNPVYAQAGTDCSAVTPDSSEIQYFSDDNCQIPLPFENTSLFSHCNLLLDADLLGEGNGITTPTWTLSPGSRLDLGARSLEDVVQPYLQRQVYRTVDTPRGTCSLEMRVYADSPVPIDDQTRPSMLALHGGSWSARGFGFFGLELTIPHYVEQGFVVYAPFYRLLSDSEGSAACNQATITQIADDASAALAWVEQNSSRYQSEPVPVVFGQSAGAHLATSLLVNEPDKVAGAVLFYPPTDFTDFALRAQQGLYTDEQGLGILERLIGVEADLVDISASPVPENSFPVRIVEQGISVPPVLMVHGMRDTLVEARQSVRLCDALAGRMLQEADSQIDNFVSLRQTIACGADSELQLIREGQHALDVCLADTLLPTDLCPSGSSASRDEVSIAIGEAVAFAARLGRADEPSEDTPAGEELVQSQSSGGGSLSWFVLLLGVVAIRRYRTTPSVGGCIY